MCCILAPILTQPIYAQDENTILLYTFETGNGDVSKTYLNTKTMVHSWEVRNGIMGNLDPASFLEETDQKILLIFLIVTRLILSPIHN